MSAREDLNLRGLENILKRTKLPRFFGRICKIFKYKVKNLWRLR